MRTGLSPLAIIAAGLPFVLGHGQVYSVVTSSGTYKAADAYAAASDPNSPIRKLNTVGPAAPFTGADIVCGPGGNTPVTPLAEAKAGSLVTFDWGSWGSSHSGPVMTYIAKCTNGCASFKGDTGNVWVKIDQDGHNPARTDIPWGENIIRMKGGKYSVTIPTGLQDGEYLLRHEILGLHVAGNLNGAQFYPNCIQIKVTGGGSTALPSGIALPGAYQPQDPGILVELWRISPSSPNYTIPGGPVLLKGGSGDWGNDMYGGGTPPPPNPSPSTTTGGSIPTTTGATVAKYGQCGGLTYTGPTACVSGTTCTKLNDYYSQCI